MPESCRTNQRLVGKLRAQRLCTLQRKAHILDMERHTGWFQAFRDCRDGVQFSLHLNAGFPRADTLKMQKSFGLGRRK